MSDTSKDTTSETGDAFKVSDRRFWSEQPEGAEPRSGQTSADAEQPGGSQTMAFQAETEQLLDLMVHSLYSDKEIFLRELISNASDALDALRFAAVTQPDLIGDEELTIRLSSDRESRKLVIADNGIGMSREEVVANIGTIAKSGTRELLERIKSARTEEQMDAAQLIGQFGVGFYSAFMVADRITLLTRRAGEQQATRWTSTGDGTYTVSPAEKADQGTAIELSLKPVDRDAGLDDFTDPLVLERIVKKYSDFVRYPIKLAVPREKAEQQAEAAEQADREQADDGTQPEERTLNSMRAIWKRRRSDVSDEEYAAFYKQITHDWEDPLETIHLAAEGRLEYQALLFIPGRAPYDVYYQGAEQGLQLYVRSVRIMERCEALLPGYLRFVRGVVESADLPLNVSREILQNDRQIAQIRRGLVKKVLDTLARLRDDDRERYARMWRELGRVVKEGITTDRDNADKLRDLLLFESSASEDGLTTLAEYVERMKDDQSEIYYITAESRAIAERSPHLEAFFERGYEVLYLVDPIDELVAETLGEVDDKKLRSVGKGEAELGSEQERKQREEQREALKEQASGLLARLQRELDEHVKEVRLSSRLTSSPACLVGGEHDLSPHIERLLARSREGGLPRQKRILELNGEHPIFAAMKRRYDEDEDDPRLSDYAQLLFGQALLAEGSELHDPPEFARLVAELMVRAA